MSKFPKYPEIPLLYRRPELFAVKEVICCEKIHGSSFRLHFPLGMTSIDEVIYGSREMDSYEEGFPLGRIVELFKAQPEQLAKVWEVIQAYGFSEVTIFGEAYGPGIKAKGVKYSDGHTPLFRAFDIMVGSNFLTYDLFVEVADKMNLPRVHIVYRGEPTQEAFDGLLEMPSLEATLNMVGGTIDTAEGIVIRSNPLFRDVFGDWIIAKHKSKKFSEVAHAPAEVKVRGAGPVDAFAATYVTKGRVENAVGRLTDRGVVLSNSMKDMPTLLDDIIADLHKECGQEWQALGLPDSQLKGAVSRVLGPIYREALTL